MTRTAGRGRLLALVLLGAGWGLTQVLTKVAVSTGHAPLGLIFWQLLVTGALLGCLVALRGRRLPLGPAQLRAAVYTGHVWMVGAAGAVFSAQVAYLVTLFGVAWSMVLLGEGYSPFIWTALAVMLAGIYLVQPRRDRRDLGAGADGID